MRAFEGSLVFFYVIRMVMKIERVINNNVISAIDDDGSEIVITGKGIGFQAKAGQEVRQERAEKIFRLEDAGTASRFKELLEAMPLEHLKLSAEIIDYAKSVMRQRLNQNIYITLTDHINFTIERFKNGMVFPNPLLLEVKNFYPSEYLIGEYAIALIERAVGVRLSEDEAASIALHIVNAEYNMGMGNTMKITTLISEVMQIVTSTLDITLDEGSLHYSRFITHLKFLSQRVFTRDMLDSGDTELEGFISKLYPQEYECSKKVAKYIEEQYQHTVSREELAYLTVHIKRVRPEDRKEN